MTLLDLDAERLIQEAELRIRQDRAKRLEAIPYEARLWLAVVPAWTLRLAEAVAFPHDARGIVATVDSLVSEGLCEWGRDALGTPDRERRRFWMPARVRPDVIRDMLQDVRARSIDVAGSIGQIGQRISRAGVPADDVPEVVRRWAELAQHAPNTVAVAGALERQISECLQGDGDIADGASASRPDDAMSWIDAARPLGDLLGEAVSAAIRLQSRRIDLVYRQRDDRRHLERFLLRDEPSAAFQRLITASNEHWALHFVGAGGVGKTMLLRYISGVWAAHQKTATARIDFDYINPEFPSRAPALLLAHLMQDLRLHAGPAADRSFSSFESKMLALHERARAALASGRGVTPAEIADVVGVFAEAVSMLPQPVVLLLDTCEELAKVRVGGAHLPEAVEATLGILEAVHRSVPTVRVVFCGRRPLASAGDGWSLPGSAYPARSYLALHELRGFTLEEGRHFLTLPASGVHADLVEPILNATVDDSAPMGFVVSVPDAKEPPHRYAPFDLSLYARWAREDPKLSKEVILAGNVDPYIETRVVGRVIRPALRELLPIIALAGRFDRTLLRAASARPDAEFEDAVRELREHDWVIQEQDDFFEVKRHLRKRLVAYLERSGRAVVSIARNRAADHLVSTTVTAPLESLTISHFEATMRLLEADTAREFQWWDDVEQRFAAGGDLKWAQQLAESLLADTNVTTTETAVVAGPPTVPLRPAILATYASVLVQLGLVSQLGAIWRAVEANAPMDPRPDVARRLTLRARAGQVAAARSERSALGGATLDAFIADAKQALTQPLDDRVAAPLTNAFEALVEMRELAPTTDVNTWVETLSRFADAVQNSPVAPEIKVFTSTLQARAAGREGWARPARQAWKRALVASRDLAGRTRQRWLDWHAPDDVQERVRLEFARAASPALYTARDAKRKTGVSIPPVVSIDADRLASMVLRLRGAQRVPTLSDVRQWAYSSAPGDSAERCNAHRAVEPLFAAYSVVEALVYGQVDAAVDDLRARFDDAERTSQLRTAEALELARLRIARRMRLRDEESVSDSLSRLGSDATYATDLHALAAFDAGSRPESRVPADGSPAFPTGSENTERWLHLYWRSIPTVTSDGAEWATRWAARVRFQGVSAPPSLDNVMCRMDLVEANLVAERYQLTHPFPELADRRSAMRQAEAAALSWMRVHPLEREAHLRLHLRLGALGFRKGKSRSAVELLGNHMGWRLAADIALDEGELLALRLPAQAEWLLGIAGVWFARGKDSAASFVVATGRALAAAAAGNGSRLGAALKEAKKHYDRVVTGVPEGGTPDGVRRPASGLPSWSSIVKIARTPNANALGTLAPVGWRPWLVRVIATKAWQMDRDRFGERSAIVGEWVKDHYASVPSTTATGAGGMILPPELAPWTPVKPPPAPQSAPLPEAAPMPLAPQQAVAPSVPVPPAVPASTVRLYAAVESMQSGRVAPRADARVRVRISGGQQHWGLELEGVCRGALDYTSAARELCESAGKVAALQSINRPGFISLSIDGSVASFGWEGIITALVSGLEPRTQLPAFRTAPLTRGMGSAPLGKVARVLSILGDLSLGRIVSDAWSQVHDRSAADFEFQLSEGVRSPNAMSVPTPTVLHVIGAPVETGYGDAALQIAPSSGGEQTVVYKSNAAERAGHLVRMRDLRRQFPKTDLILLQAYPIAGGHRGPTDQECAGFLRLMACELAELGASVAVTIPPLPPRESMECLILIGQALNAPDGIGSPVLLTALRDVQRLVVQHGSLKGDDSIAAAADFCLYAASHLITS